jgi:chloramphenicol-sensitive protein RarD
VGIGCYLIWGLTPALFIAISRAGASAWEIVGERATWAAPWAALLVLVTGRGAAARAAFRRPRLLGLLAISAVMIGGGWIVYVWAVTTGHNLEAALGYYIAPLLNMAVGALFFRERITPIGAAAIALATIGVALQAMALGHPPLIALFLAVSFWAYGLIRRQVDADAQTGLLVECLLMAGPGLLYVLWLHHVGGGVFGRSLRGSLLLMTAGPATVATLALFTWTARRLPLSTFGFLQFLSPTVGFLVGLANGERMTPLIGLSFAFIWAGSAAFVLGAWRASRRLQRQA